MTEREMLDDELAVDDASELSEPSEAQRPASGAPRVSPVAAWEALFRAQVTVMRTLAEDFPSHVISLTEYDVLYTLSIQANKRMGIRDLNSPTLLTQPR